MYILVVPPPVDSVNATDTSVFDTEAEVVVTWEPVEYVSVYFISDYGIVRLYTCTFVNQYNYECCIIQRLDAM